MERNKNVGILSRGITRSYIPIGTISRCSPFVEVLNATHQVQADKEGIFENRFDQKSQPTIHVLCPFKNGYLTMYTTQEAGTLPPIAVLPDRQSR